MRWFFVLTITSMMLGCRQARSPDFVLTRSDHSVSGPSAYPTAVDPRQVGSYPANTKSGAGYFYDEVLEYRVWLHPENGAQDIDSGSDYFVAFAQYEKAEAFAKAHPGSEEAIVLIRQIEYIDEPEPRHYVPVTEPRITEWQVGWLADSKRTPTSIPEFMKHPRPTKQ